GDDLVTGVQTCALPIFAVETDWARSRRDREASSARPRVRIVGQGDGWAVADVVCAAGPHDRPFEERHEKAAVAVVAAGTFQYRPDRKSGVEGGGVRLGP